MHIHTDNKTNIKHEKKILWLTVFLLSAIMALGYKLVLRWSVV